LVSKTEVVWENGKKSQLKHLERPQIWFSENGDPAILFCASKLASPEVKNGDSVLTMNIHIPLKMN